MTIFEKVKKLGIVYDNHCSDLYIPVNDETKKLVHEYVEYKQCVTTFNCQTDGALWFNIAFAYDPWWHDAEKQVETWAKVITNEG